MITACPFCLEMVREVDSSIDQRLFIDARAGVLDPRFHEQEGGVNGDMHKRMGSTGEGVGPARMARIERDSKTFELFHQIADEYDFGHLVKEDTPKMIASCYNHGQNILLEGAQGCGLSLIHGTWPYTTSHDTNAAQLAADCGIGPTMVDEVMMVFRAFPIRVAGNSGPLKNETDWEYMSSRVGEKIASLKRAYRSS